MTTDLRQRLLTLVEELPEETLLQAETLLIALRVGPITATQTALNPENHLIELIQRRLPPEEQTRLHTLRQRLHDETITDAEHQELLTFVERVEALDVQRAEAMIQLAQLRNVDLNIIIQEFLPKPQLSHAL